MTVLVCGATGTTGSEVLRQLRAAGVAVRAMTRNEASAARLGADGIEAVAASRSMAPRCSRPFGPISPASGGPLGFTRSRAAGISHHSAG